MTVLELCELFTDSCEIGVYSFEEGAEIWRGSSDEIPKCIGNAEISSIDAIYPESKYFSININDIKVFYPF